MIAIGQNLYEHNLLELFWTYKPTDEEDQKLYVLLNRVCRAWINKRDDNNPHDTISGINMSEEEQKIVLDNRLMEHPNLEVRTRFTDVMIRFGKGKERLERMRKASDGYLELCKETGTYLYFVRSIEVRQAKLLFDDPFLREMKEVVISTGIHPVWLTKTLDHVKANVDDGLENKYLKEILSVYTAAIPESDPHWVDAYWKMMESIGAIEESEAHYRRALNWEAYADKIEANKKENVFNANLHMILQDSHNEMFEVRDKYPEDYKRIRDKYNAAKKDFVESMSLFGVKTKYEIPEMMIEHICKKVSAIHLGSIEEALIHFMSVPFFPAWTDLVEENLQKNIQQSEEIERLFPKSQTLDNEGNVIGESDFENDKKLQVHRYFRTSFLYFLVSLYERVGEHILAYGEGRFYGLLCKCRPSYVEADRVQIWAKAYHYYFNGDIIIASHLLMPQFEHTLHNLLEEIVGDVTKLNQNIQNEPTLIGILKQLEPYCNPTLYDELSIFLVDSNDVNYRNRLMHGLMWSMDMLRYGHYLFYLSNMLYFKGKDFLKIGEHQDENENNY